MIKEKINKCIRLADEMMLLPHRSKLEMHRDHIHENYLCIGSIASEYYHEKSTTLVELYFYRNIEILKGMVDKIVKREKRIRKRV